MQPFGRNGYGPKIGRGELGPHLTQCGQAPRDEAYLHAKFILIRSTVWPQCTNVTDRRDRQNRTDNVTTVR